MKHPLIIATLILSAFAPLHAAAPAKPAFESEQWPKGVTLVWANPGTSGEFGNASNWKTEDGKPAIAAPDRNTDIVLPKADTNYAVTGGRNNQVRHVTVEDKARITGGHRNELEIWGNCTVKPGGMARYISIVGDKHTFFRLEEGVWPDDQNNHEYQHPTRKVPDNKQSRTQISHKFQIAKYGTASVEFFGNVGVSDEVMLQHGKMIISGDFRFSGITGKGNLEIYDGGILEIQSGGRVGPFDPGNSKGVYNFNIYRNGVIQAGSPERPLTSDAYLLLGFTKNEKPGSSGLYSALGSMMRVYSSDPTKFRLVISSTVSVPDFRNGRGQPIGAPDSVASGNLGTAMQLAGDVLLDGVHFDYVSQGGIALADPDTAKKWKNVTFGKHNAGKASDLISKMTADPNSYYHARGDMQSEYNLTVRAMSSMQDFLKQADPFLLATTPSSSEVIEVKRGKDSIKTPVAVVFEKPIEVTVTTKIPGARLRFTLDGTEPTKDSPEYSKPIPLAKTTKLMVKGYKQGVGFSPTFSTTYVFK
jgi:Chitobiase/beta-hexosaminidase C-terminal domain